MATRGQSIRQLVQVAGNAEFRSQVLHSAVTFKAEYFAAEVHIVTHGKVGQQTAGLYHVTEMSLAQIAQLVEFAPFPAGLDVQRFLVAFGPKAERAGGGRPQKEGKHVQHGRLAAAGFSGQGYFLTHGDLQAGHPEAKGHALGLTRFDHVTQVIHKCSSRWLYR
jgi:hypothetical protein